MNIKSPNPLVEHLPVWSDLEALFEQLKFAPIDHEKVCKYDLIDRVVKLDSSDRPFQPTEKSLKVAVSIGAMIRGGYEARNPLNPENRMKILNLSNDVFTSVKKLPKRLFGKISVFVLKGVTGTGKTIMLKRILSLLPEGLVHGENQAAGWQRLTQIIYLYVEMPGEGSRGGLIQAILEAIDRVLETKYAIDLPKQIRSIDRLEVKTISLLHTFYTGLLVIDELQIRNIVESPQSKVMQLFLLSIINTGIPVVLSGNTKGFEWIEKLSQDVTRIYSAPPVILHPFPSPEESDEWDFIFNSTCSFYVLKRQSNDEVMSKLLWAVSGGIPRIAINIWIEAQKNRLYKKDNNQLQLKDLIDVYESEGLEKIRKIAKGFAMKDPILLKEFSDIPWKDYGKKWGKLGAQNIESEVAADNSVNQSVNDLEDTAKGRKVSEKSKMKSKQTRKKNKERQRSKVKKNLSPSDLRGKDDGLTQVLLDGLAGVV